MFCLPGSGLLSARCSIKRCGGSFCMSAAPPQSLFVILKTWLGSAEMALVWICPRRFSLKWDTKEFTLKVTYSGMN